MSIARMIKNGPSNLQVLCAFKIHTTDGFFFSLNKAPFWDYRLDYTPTYTFKILYVFIHYPSQHAQAMFVFYLSNLWCADSQGASRQSGYGVWLITRSHDQKFLSIYFGRLTPRKVEITIFDFLRGTPNPRWLPPCDNPLISVILAPFYVNTEFVEAW